MEFSESLWAAACSELSVISEELVSFPESDEDSGLKARDMPLPAGKKEGQIILTHLCQILVYYSFHEFVVKWKGK